MKKPKPVHYVNNKQMYETMKVYIKAVRKSKREKVEAPRIPEYIGECLYLICNKLSLKPQFSGYTWRDEMISDGIENCIVAIDNFDPRKSDNPFAYFTMIAWNAFIRRIQREKKQTYIKHKNMQNTFIVDELASEFGMQVTGDQKSDDVIRDFEQKAENNKKKKKKTAKKKGLEIFT
jgi:DNA-directed RNA polymerase specialized sigma24 family protein